MEFLKSLFSQKSKTTAPSPPEHTSNSYTSQAISPSGYFCFTSGILPSADDRYSTAHFEDGVVYYDFTSGKTPIGYYEDAEDGSYTKILCESDREEIGRMDEDGTVWLTRAGLYHRFSKYAYTKFPSPLLCEVGRLCGDSIGILDEADTHISLGAFRGEKAGAAAAFVCLVYECHTYYKYRQFFDREHWD